MTKITGALNLKIPLRDLKSKDTRHLLSLIFTQWLSLSSCIIQSVIDVIPAPAVAQAARVPKMLYPDLSAPTLEPKNKLERDLFTANSNDDAYVCAYVSKMFAVSKKDLPENKKTSLTAEEMRNRARDARMAREDQQTVEEDTQAALSDLNLSAPPKKAVDIPPEEGEVILGFARLYSGTIQTGTTVYGVLPKYNPDLEPTHPLNTKYLITATVEGLYVMMGRELSAVDSVRAGNIFAIKGLEGKVWRSATLCAPSHVGIPEDADASQLKDCLLNLGGVNRAVRISVLLTVSRSDISVSLRLLQSFE